jgi:phosphohistidine phosphatase
MEIYLMQHGEAYPEEEDPERKLTPQGREQIKLAGRILNQLGITFDTIISSPKARAKQTAEIVSQETGFPEEDIQITETLSPTAPAQSAIDYLNRLGSNNRILLCGHLPSLAEISSLLLCKGSRVSIGFQMGGICRIDIENLLTQEGVIRWLLPPELISFRFANLDKK